MSSTWYIQRRVEYKTIHIQTSQLNQRDLNSAFNVCMCVCMCVCMLSQTPILATWDWVSHNYRLCSARVLYSSARVNNCGNLVVGAVVGDSHNYWPRGARVLYSSARVNNCGKLKNVQKKSSMYFNYWWISYIHTEMNRLKNRVTRTISTRIINLDVCAILQKQWWMYWYGELHTYRGEWA
jgi:hypothetical protein